MRQRRRAERGHFAPSRNQDRPIVTRRDTEGRQRKLLLIGIVAIAAVLLGLLGYGWFSSSFQPPRQTIAGVDGEDLKLREVVPQTLLDLTITGVADPRTSLSTLVRDRLLRGAASDLGIAVTDEDLDLDLVARFEPISDPDVDPPTSLSDEGQRSFDLILDALEVDADQYVEWREGVLLESAARAHFVEEEPETVEQVFVSWIVTASQLDIEEAMTRIAADEEFADVALDFDEQGLDTETGFSAANGEVGWIPRGAFPELDDLLFDTEIEQGTPIGPLPTVFGSMVFVVTDGPSDETLSDSMRQLTAGTAFQVWMDDQAVQRLGAFGLSDEDVSWVLRELCDLDSSPINCSQIG
jgi:hypothetical protein